MKKLYRPIIVNGQNSRDERNFNVYVYEKRLPTNIKMREEVNIPLDQTYITCPNMFWK